jgi:sugar phosphate isomerase/epimerase
MRIRRAAIVIVLSAGAALSAAEPGKRGSGAPTSRPARHVSAQVACSSLCQVKHPLEDALKTISQMGYKYVDLSCLNWPPSPPHVNVDDLVKDFDKEASRVETALKANKLKVSNLTFDTINPKEFDTYSRRFEAVARLAERLRTRVINIMAPPKASDRADNVARLTVISKIAAGYKVQLTLETHCGQVTELPADAAWYCRQVPGLGLTLDPSHYYAGPNQGKAFEELYPFIRGTGFRAGAMSWETIQMPWGEGPIDFADIVHKLEAAGYRGFYVAEYIEGFNKLDPLEESRKFLAWARSLK